LCTDEGACNYLSNPTEACLYLDAIGDCGGDCAEDTDGDGVCDLINNACDNLESVLFDGYTYDLIAIGDQCWFAENLRTEHYTNGDTIPANLTGGEWSNTLIGAVAVFGEDDACYNYSPDGDACDDPGWSLTEYGRLYNWFAVDDVRGLCPTGWHVPTDGEWMVLEMELGMSESDANSVGWRGTGIGTQMKTTYGYNGGGNGTNSSGFSGLPGGFRNIYGYFSDTGLGGRWWTSSHSGVKPWSRGVYDAGSTVHRGDFGPARTGRSIRCVRD
jgi:uncharacterized protein (TIGR02145 family)